MESNIEIKKENQVEYWHKINGLEMVRNKMKEIESIMSFL